MKFTKIIFVFSLVILGANSSTFFAQSAKEIAYKVYDRSAPSNGESDMTMTLINKKGGERVRSLHQFFIDLGEEERQIMFFTAPADVKNTSFMNFSYDAAERDDDQWLYLPALKKVKRISSSSKDNEFMGSDFTYEDMEKRSPDRDVQTFLRSESFNGEEVWVIEATPIEEEQYTKRVVWISKEKNIPLKMDFYDEDEELLKTLTVEKTDQIKGYWIITNQVMHNVQKNHKTIISLENVQVENGTDQNKFTQREMERGL